MELKIFLTGDNHIGLKFNNYPDYIKQDLIDARIENLKGLVEKADQESCDLFVIAGDLFDKIRIAKKDIEKTAKALKEFSGTVLVMPGNHDYCDDVVDLWNHFKTYCGENTIILNKWQPFNLKDNDIDAVIYPAHCNQKHSDTNCLGWINDADKPEGKWHIGLAHGALDGLSPDLDNRYFNMSEKELMGIDMDLWLLGHTHIPYPKERNVNNRKIFNAGTPEPDGLDCRHGGNAWVITVNGEKEVKGEQIETGLYRFYDMDKTIESLDCLDKITQEIISDSYERKIVRLNLAGRVDRNIFDKLQDFYEEIKGKVAHFQANESDLVLKITNEEIEKEYTKDSFPYQILNKLMDEDEEALQLAYELLGGCKNEN